MLLPAQFTGVSAEEAASDNLGWPGSGIESCVYKLASCQALSALSLPSLCKSREQGGLGGVVGAPAVGRALVRMGWGHILLCPTHHHHHHGRIPPFVVKVGTGYLGRDPALASAPLPLPMPREHL